MGRSPLIVIFFTVFIDLIGFGMIIPLTPYLAPRFGATPFQVGLLMTSYSLMQFLFSPVWGRLSDRIGRRPVILVSLLGGALSYVGFAFSTHLWMLFVARSFAGLCGANISTAMAYIADVTKPEERSKGMGLIGAAFGLGFIFGPAMGGFLSVWGLSLGSEPPYGISFAALGAATICFLNFLLAFRNLKESLSPELRRNLPKRAPRLRSLWVRLQTPVVGPLMIVLFLSGLAMAHMESTLGLFVKDQFAWNLREASFAFAWVGVMMVFTQGYLIRKLMPKWGERSVLMIGLALGAVGIAGIGLVFGVFWLAFSTMLLALGIGFTNPAILGSISVLTPPSEQGHTLGVTQSLSALGRILGPALGGYFYGSLGHSFPFYFGGLLMGVGLLIVLSLASKLPQAGKSAASRGH